MTRLAVAAVSCLFALSACDSPTTCESAQGKVDQCEAERPVVASGYSYQRYPLSFEGKCSGVNACAASCVNAVSCAAINWLELNQQTDPEAPPNPPGSGELVTCIQKCIDAGR